MLDLNDKRWANLRGGYRTPSDPRPLIAELEAGGNPSKVWQVLWEELHHQGDVGEASFAAVPLLVSIYSRKPSLDWNTYALVAIIELARAKGENPDVPDWLAQDYFRAIQDLSRIAATELSRAEKPEDIRAILSIIALSKGLRNHAKFLLIYSEDELSDIESAASESNE
jgi:hypothetical protein